MFAKISAFVNEKRNLRIGLILTIFLFICYKFSDLFLPYYWDELGVYARAILYMYDHELGLFPKNIPPELSRGHPLLFHFIYASLFKFFGSSIFVGHSISLFISVLVLLSVYLFTKDFFDEKIGLIAVIILVVQPLFLAQSTFLLPEMLLVLFTIGAIYFYLKKKIVIHVLLSSCAILTKETGIVIVAAIFACELIRLLNKRINVKIFLKNIIIVLTPIYLFVIFLCFQKMQNGWYFFPIHVGADALNLEGFTTKLDDYFNFVFMRQGRDPWCVVLVYGFIAAILNNGKRLLKNETVNVIIILTLVMFLFSSFNFYMNRYMLMLVVIWSVFVSLSLKEIYQLTNRYIKQREILIASIIILIGFIVIMPLFYINARSFSFDDDMGYKKIVHVQQEAYNWLINKTNQSDNIYGNFQMMIAITDPRLGYVSDNELQISTNYTDSTKYVAVVSPGNIDYAFPIGDFHLVKKFENDFAYVKIFKRIK